MSISPDIGHFLKLQIFDQFHTYEYLHSIKKINFKIENLLTRNLLVIKKCYKYFVKRRRFYWLFKENILVAWNERFV